MEYGDRRTDDEDRGLGEEAIQESCRKMKEIELEDSDDDEDDFPTTANNRPTYHPRQHNNNSRKSSSENNTKKGSKLKQSTTGRLAQDVVISALSECIVQIYQE